MFSKGDPSCPRMSRWTMKCDERNKLIKFIFHSVDWETCVFRANHEKFGHATSWLCSSPINQQDLLLTFQRMRNSRRVNHHRNQSNIFRLEWPIWENIFIVFPSSSTSLLASAATLSIWMNQSKWQQTWIFHRNLFWLFTWSKLIDRRLIDVPNVSQ